jgi:hypothetical protein
MRPTITQLDETSPLAPHPPCGVELRPHQLATLYRCLELESGDVPLERCPTLSALAPCSRRRRLGPSQPQPTGFMRTMMGVLGDKAGSGKSFVVLALVDAGRAVQPKVNPYVQAFADNLVVVSADQAPSPSQLGLTLLVVPHNLCSQWESYIKRYGAGLRTFAVSRKLHVNALCIARKPPAPEEAVEAEAVEAVEEAVAVAPPPPVVRRNTRRAAAAAAPTEVVLGELDVLLVSGALYNSVSKLLVGREVRRLVFDEADAIALPACVPVATAFTWYVTASYRNLLFPWGDGGSGSYATTALHPGYVRNRFLQLQVSSASVVVAHALVVRNTDEHVDASLVLPSPEVEIVLCRAPPAVLVLSGLAGMQAILACLNAHDVESAMAHISSANRMDEDNVVAALMGKMGREAHNLEQRLALLDSMAFADDEERTVATERLTKKLEDAQRRMASVRDRVTDSDMCSICFDALSNKTVVPCCSNSFCFKCINRWLIERSPTCPLCKTDVSVPELLVIPDPPTPMPNKMEALALIVQSRCAVPGASKLLIFSSFENTLHEITRKLDRLGVKHRMLKGNPTTLDAIQKNFRDADLDVLLCNARNYGSGLNFPNTTDIIMLHKFDTDLEQQVIGRAQRMGRTQPLRVWYLLHDNERT